MRPSPPGHPKIFWLFILVLGISGCASIAVFDQYAYTQATSLKVDLQNLIDLSASKTYSQAKVEIEEANTSIMKAYEYEKGRKKAEIMAKMYGILLSEDGSYKKYLKKWKEEGKQSAAFVEEAKVQIGKLMDQIIQLEGGLIKESDVSF